MHVRFQNNTGSAVNKHVSAPSRTRPEKKLPRMALLREPLNTSTAVRNVEQQLITSTVTWIR